MGALIDKAKGATNEALGKAKVAAGQRTDSPKLIVSGAKQQIKGKRQKVSGAIKSAVGDKL